MCGIAGAVDLKGQREFPAGILLQMTGALSHRGPDDEQIHIEPGVALGVRRLSVIDVAAGRQPMCNETGRICLRESDQGFETLSDVLELPGIDLTNEPGLRTWLYQTEDRAELLAPPVLRRFVRRNKQMSSSVLSNVGRVFEDPSLPKKSGKVCLGETTLDSIEFLVPLRPGTEASFGMSTYAGRLTLCLHYKPHKIRSAAAQELFNLLISNLKESAAISSE